MSFYTKKSEIKSVYFSNFLSDHWIELKFCQKFSKIFFYLGLEFQGDQSLVRLFDNGLKLLFRFYRIFSDDIHGGLLLINSVINNSMVKYKYPIPRLDDILNELHGCCMFEK